ncbi:hypothetical protein HDZ31DRAFT_30784 [Schizophyllum fasciatum]
MDAYRYHPGNKNLVKETVPVPKPGPDEVLIKVLAAGMCHSDLLYFKYDNMWASRETFTMGHEGAGTIAALGADVPARFPALILGAYVAALARNACFAPACANCGVGADNLCAARWAVGFGADGFYAPYCAVRAATVVRVPGGLAGEGGLGQESVAGVLHPAHAAVATDAVLTSYHALKANAGIQPGQTVLIIGAGGLGLNGVQIAKNVLGAKCVIACDVRESSLQDARALGADYTALPDALPALLQDNGLVVDVACDFVGLNETFNAALKAVRPKGTLQVVGLTAPSVDLPLIPAADKDLTIRFSMWGKLDELREVLQHVLDGKITPRVETRPLASLVETFEDFMNGRIQSRMVLIPEH